MPGVATTSVAGGGLLALITTTAGNILWRNTDLEPRPVISVNQGDVLLSDWPSEHPLAPLDMNPECRFWNFSVAYEATLCSHFTISRTTSAQQQARNRALKCAAIAGVECVLSPEVGFAVPAAFLVDASSTSTNRMTTMILGPKLVAHESEQKHVRLRVPDVLGAEPIIPSLGTTTVTVVLNETIRAQYMAENTLQDKIFGGASAYCIQLLRFAFEKKCWELLD